MLHFRRLRRKGERHLIGCRLPRTPHREISSCIPELPQIFKKVYEKSLAPNYSPNFFVSTKVSRNTMTNHSPMRLLKGLHGIALPRGFVPYVEDLAKCSWLSRFVSFRFGLHTMPSLLLLERYRAWNLGILAPSRSIFSIGSATVPTLNEYTIMYLLPRLIIR